MKINFCLCMLISILFSCRNKQAKELPFLKPQAIPVSIKSEHDSLLKKASAFLTQDDTSTAAKKFFDLLQHHFAEEEEYVLPALSLLPLLANNQMPDDPKTYLALIEKFKKNAAHISAEHQFIKVYLDELKLIPSKKELQFENFERSLHKHAASEEEIYFPAVILVGKFLEERVAKK